MREAYLSEAERHYENNSLPLFKIAFSRLDETSLLGDMGDDDD